MEEFINSSIPSWQTIFLSIKISTVMFVISIVIAITVVVLLPADYYSDVVTTETQKQQHSISRWMIFLFKNLIGVVMVLVGVLMLLLPGQGLMTILIGIVLLDFPKKRQLEKKIICKPRVLNAFNLIRKRFGKKALIIECC